MAGIIGINSIGSWLKKEFGEKVIKLAIDGGFTCPNRDGTLGYGGCAFCSSEGSGELASSIYGNGENNDDAIARAIEEQIRMRREKWPNAKKFIAYFQSHTNTYAPVGKLRPMFEAAISQSGIVGLAIATRPDCLPDDVLDLLGELNEKTFLWVELGLQTIHEDTFGRRCTLEDYDRAAAELHARGIRTVTHLILGLPGESRGQMEESVRYVCREPHIFGIKLHLLNIVKGSGMEKTHCGYEPFDSIEDYVSFVCDLLEIIPADITIHRLTGDVPRKLLISPEWSYKKRTILNGIAHELRMRGTYQGCALE